jgi:hypothetical protein
MNVPQNHDDHDFDFVEMLKQLEESLSTEPTEVEWQRWKRGDQRASRHRH